MGIEHRAGRTGQAGVTPPKVFVLMNRQRLALHQACADTVGPLARLAPVSAQPQARPLKYLALSRRRDAVQNDPASIRQQHRMPGTRKLLVQAVHFMPGKLQHLLQTLAPLQNSAVFKHRRGDGLCRIKVVVVQAALPGTNNRGVATQRTASGDIQDLPRMAA